MTLLHVSNIDKTYEASPLLQKINFRLEKGQILCLLGPSGCGKSTLLRIIAGLETAEKGQVFFDGTDISEVPPHHRNFGMMFQEFALFPHRNVFDNVAFGLQIQKLSTDMIKKKVTEALDLVGLGHLEQRRVDDLSGGERQRVALARSLAPQPQLLMLDEPMGSLDRMLRERLILDLRNILKRIGMTAIFVTHDHTEAFAIADLIAVFDEGQIAQIAPPEVLYQSPTHIGVARFLGFDNFINGIVLDEKSVETNMGVFQLANLTPEKGAKVTLLIRPEAGRILAKNEAPKVGETVIQGTATDHRFQGAYSRVTFQLQNSQLIILTLSIDETVNNGNESVKIALAHSSIVILPDRAQ
jgi:ABC-type Fe3+/spermidine/putrescine transport system ATPase subunit